MAVSVLFHKDAHRFYYVKMDLAKPEMTTIYTHHRQPLYTYSAFIIRFSGQLIYSFEQSVNYGVSSSLMESLYSEALINHSLYKNEVGFRLACSRLPLIHLYAYLGLFSHLTINDRGNRIFYGVIFCLVFKH